MVCASAATNGRSNGRFSYSPIRRATSLCHRIAFPSFTDRLRSPGVKFSNGRLRNSPNGLRSACRVNVAVYSPLYQKVGESLEFSATDLVGYLNCRHLAVLDRAVAEGAAAPETVAAYLAFEAARHIRPSTIGRRLAAIRYAHRLAGHVPPTADERVLATLRGIRRAHGIAPLRKAPATTERIIVMVPIGRERLSDIRDRALLLIGFAGAFRRSELVALNVEDIQKVAEGLRIYIRRGKTDQEGRNELIAIPRGAIACPVNALANWIAAAGSVEGPVFRPIAKGGRLLKCRLTDRSVAKIIKLHAARVGL
jgi:integrase